MRIVNTGQYPPDFDGNQPELLQEMGVAFDGGAGDYLNAPVGTLCAVNVATGHSQLWQKVKNDGAHTDWACIHGVISQLCLFSDFTDGGAAAGTLTLDNQLPAGAFVDSTAVQTVTQFATVSTLVLTVGDGSDVDRFNTGTPSIAGAPAHIVMGVPSGVRTVTAATNIVLTATEDSDWGDITAGALVIRVHYHI